MIKVCNNLIENTVTTKYLDHISQAMGFKQRSTQSQLSKLHGPLFQIIFNHQWHLPKQGFEKKFSELVAPECLTGNGLYHVYSTQLYLFLQNKRKEIPQAMLQTVNIYAFSTTLGERSLDPKVTGIQTCS